MRPLLLLDLDGVLVVEMPQLTGQARQMLALHPKAAAMLAAAGQEACILTHRSRGEARQLLRAAELEHSAFIRLFAAEDLLIEACKAFEIREAFSGGLRKSFALQRAEKVTGYSRTDMVAIDDRQHNLDALLEAGLGLALRAPCALSADGRALTTFDLTDTLDRLSSWHQHGSFIRQIDLAPVERPVEQLQISGLPAVSREGWLFRRSRRLVAQLRKRRKSIRDTAELGLPASHRGLNPAKVENSPRG